MHQGGLQQQQQPSIEARQEEDRATAMVATRPVAALPPVGHGRRTTTPAWTTGGSALVTGGLQELSGVQQGEGLPSETAATRLPVIPLPVGRGRSITTPTWTSVGTRGSAPHQEDSNGRSREGRCRGGIGLNQVIGGVKYHQVVDLRRGHGHD